MHRGQKNGEDHAVKAKYFSGQVEGWNRLPSGTCILGDYSGCSESLILGGRQEHIGQEASGGLS